MKIAHLISQYYPHIGGAEICVHNVASKLVEMDCEAVVVTTTPPSPDHPDLPYPVERLHPKTNGILARMPRLGGWLLRRQLEKLQKRHSFDLWQVTMGWPIGVHTVRFFKDSGIPCVLRCCGEDIQKVPEINYGYRLDNITDRAIRTAYPQFDAFVALTPTVEQEYLELGIPNDKIRIIPNGADTAGFAMTQPSSELRKRFGAKGKLMILTTGRYHPKKGFDLIPEIASKLKSSGFDFSWVVAGPGTSNLARKYPAAAENGVVCSEDFTRSDSDDAFSLPPKSLVALYKTADVYALPTLVETFGMVLVEAMAAGLPILTTTAPGVDDVIADGETGLKAPPGNPTGFAEALERLLKDNALRNSLGEQAQAEAKARYDWNIVTQSYLDLYKATIDTL